MNILQMVCRVQIPLRLNDKRCIIENVVTNEEN